MQVIGGDNDHRLNAVGTCRLGLGHLAVVGIAALGRDADLGRGGGGIDRVGRQRPGDEHDLVVEPDGVAVHGADEGPAATADHAHAQPLSGAPVRRCIDHVSDPR